jgi:hypothetical protein
VKRKRKKKKLRTVPESGSFSCFFPSLLPLLLPFFLHNVINKEVERVERQCEKKILYRPWVCFLFFSFSPASFPHPPALQLGKKPPITSCNSRRLKKKKRIGGERDE